MNTRRPGMMGVAVVSVVCSAKAWAQPYLDFHDVPIVATQSEATFRQLFSRGHCGTVRAIVLGDSQESCPTGRGSVYLPRLNYELFLRYGNSPETPLAGPVAHNGGGSPWSEWLVRNSNAGPGLTESRLPPSFLPPSLAAGKSSATNGNNVNNNQWYGGLYGLQHDAATVDPGTLIDGSQEFFKRGTAVSMDIFAATNASSGEINIRVTPNESGTVGYFEPTVSLMTTNLGLEQAAFEVKKVRVGPLPFGGRPYMQVELSGSDPGKFTDILGARFVSAVDTRGWAVGSFSVGGYRIQSFLTSHADCGPILEAVEPDVAILAYGANDFWHGRSPQEFEQDVRDLIAFLRTHVSDSLPVILLAEADYSFVGFPPNYATNFDQQPGVLFEISQSMPDVCAVNGRLLANARGWTRAGGLTPFLFDGVHYTEFGARLKAQLEIEALYSTFATRCYADLDDGSGMGRPDCAVDIGDLLYFLVAFEAGSAAADLDNDGDPAVSTPDGAVDINDLLFFLSRFETGC